MSTRPTSAPNSGPWLDLYAGSRLDWKQVEQGGQTTYYRPLGLVEGLFDHDGTDFCGRADLTAALTLELHTTLTPEELRRRITLAWTVLRLHHVLLSATAVSLEDLPINLNSSGLTLYRFFKVDQPRDAELEIEHATKHVAFLSDHFARVDLSDFRKHVINTDRAIDPREALSKLFVLPPEDMSPETRHLHCVFVMAHQIVDGMSAFRFMGHFTDLINLADGQLVERLTTLCSTSLTDRLPPAQESLYPPIPGSRARQRWFWAISRILRHTHRPPPPQLPAFVNPLRRPQPLTTPPSLDPQTYSPVLSYKSPPPLCTHHRRFTLSPEASRTLSDLCRANQISVGAGLFTLVALSMMHFHRIREPETALSKRGAFVGSFPVNPRPFLLVTNPSKTTVSPGLALGFSPDGISLPYLPPDLPLRPRFRLLGRLAQRQLRTYQKRRPELVTLGSHSPTQMIPQLYLSTLERMRDRLAPARRWSVDPQGAYPPSPPPPPPPSTCGVSSVGDQSTALMSPSRPGTLATFASVGSGVRARDSEFLVGCGGSGDHIWFGLSYDANVIDPLRVEEWVEVMRDMFESPDKERARL